MQNWVGRQLGNYRLLHQLGKGSFGQVYLGEHIYLNTHAAIKLLLEDIDIAQGEAFHPAFLQEARRIANLKHPHILRVLEFGMEASTPYMVMEYAAHGTLLERHPRGTKVPVDLVVSYTKQIAQALQYAHEARLIHRDVKPANVLLDERDMVLLSDFGIATIAHHTSSMRTSGYAGTAAYMAPEQLQGKPVTASDQYALAIMVYEWLCGQLPYQGDPIAVGMQHLTAPIPSLCVHNKALSPAIEAVVHQAMAKDPKERFPTVIAFAQALECALRNNVALHPDRASVERSGRSSTVDTSPQSQPQEDILAQSAYRKTSAKEEQSAPGASGSPTIASLPMRRRHLKRNGLVAIGLLTVVLLIIAPLLSPSLAAKISITWSTLSSAVAPAHPHPTLSPPVQRRVVAKETQSQTVNATGHVTTSPATSAKGTIFVTNCNSSPLTLPGGTVLANQHTPTIQIVLDQTVSVIGGVNGSGPFPVHVVQTGTVGNINDFWYASPDYPFTFSTLCAPTNNGNNNGGNNNGNGNNNGGNNNGNMIIIPIIPVSGPSTGWAVWNPQSFTGGQDAQTAKAVQQSDIDNAASSLKAHLTQSTTSDVRKQVESNEHLISDPQCSATVSANHKASDQVAKVTVTVTMICTAIASM